MNCQKLVFSSHAIQQMFLRRISKQSVRIAITYGQIIEENLDDQPFPSYLILDFIEGQPIHIVFSYDQVTDTGYVVTAYIPNPDLWTNNYKKRR